MRDLSQVRCRISAALFSPPLHFQRYAKPGGNKRSFRHSRDRRLVNALQAGSVCRTYAFYLSGILRLRLQSDLRVFYAEILKVSPPGLFVGNSCDKHLYPDGPPVASRSPAQTVAQGVTAMEFPDTSQLRSELERVVQVRTGRRVRHLAIEVLPERVVLRGRTSSYYVKQLAQHGVRDLLPNVALENVIAVEHKVEVLPSAVLR